MTPPPSLVEAHAHTSSTPTDTPTSSALTWLAGTVFVVSVAALVVLEALERPTVTLVALVTPVIASLLVAGHVSTVTKQQNVAIDKIERQTNGVLDERIRTQVLAALTEAAPVPAVVVGTAPGALEEVDPDVEPPSTGTMPREWVQQAQEGSSS